MEVKVYFLEPKPRVYEPFREYLIDYLRTKEDIFLQKTTIDACQAVLYLGLAGQIGLNIKEGDLDRINGVLERLKNLGKKIILFSINTREDVERVFPGLIDHFIYKGIAPSEQASSLAGFLRAHFE